MKKRNNKGFFLVETLIVTTIVALAMVFLYTQIIKLIDGYELRLTYNTVDGTYGAVEFNKYILNDSAMYSYYTNSANITTNGYVDVACSSFTSPNYCVSMYSNLDISRMIVTTYNTAAIKTAAPNVEDFSDDLKLFISNIKGVNNASTTKYRLIIEYADGTYATVVLNAGTDKTAPTITGDQNLIVYPGDTYNPSDSLTATDNIYGDISSNIVCTLISGSNYICTVTDSSGNVSANFYRTILLYNAITNFVYTGAVQTYTASYTGTYKLEVWGAQGGTYSSSTGGLGGYASGSISLTTGDILYIYVGGQGNSPVDANQVVGGFNGGGYTYGVLSGAYASSGGGGTDIRRSGTALTNRIIVAGGGGGGGYYNGVYGLGGYAGGATGGTGTTVSGYTGGYGGTQAAGGAAGTTSSYSQAGSLGQGGNSTGTSGGWNGSGGGGGYYGGGSGAALGAGGGGGSSYVGSLTSSQSIAGNASMPSTSGSTETGHSGNGYARITIQ